MQASPTRARGVSFAPWARDTFGMLGIQPFASAVFTPTAMRAGELIRNRL